MVAYADGFGETGHACYFGRFFNFSLGGWIMGLIFLVVVGLVIYYAINGLKNKDTKDDELIQEALDAVKLRYAKGEITEEEYIKIKRELGVEG